MHGISTSQGWVLAGIFLKFIALYPYNIRVAAPSISVFFDQKNNVTIIAVGVNVQVSPEELNFMATEPVSQHVFKIEDYDQLLNKVEDISGAVCPTYGKEKSK